MGTLANMLAGLLISVPCICWVVVLLSTIFYILGIIFRQCVGPDDDQDLLGKCGSADFLHDRDDPNCPIHEILGEEYFPTLSKSMFTVFRCVLGDCNTRAGQSLTAHFSQEYGWKFDGVYCFGMVIVIFGLFNVITAIFVESTISGLRYNDVQIKHARMYKSKYVQRKLEELVSRLHEVYNIGVTSRGEATGSVEAVRFTESELNAVLEDHRVNELLEDLDVNMSNRTGLFDMLDIDRDGVVSIPELLHMITQVRGDLQKSDMIASWLALRHLQSQISDFKALLVVNQKKVQANQVTMEANQRAMKANQQAILENQATMLRTSAE